MKWVHCLIVAVALTLGLAAQSVSAVTIDFEELPYPDDELAGVGNYVFSKGYQFAYAPAEGEPDPVGLFSVGASWRYNGKSTALLANSCSATTTLTALDGAPFTLESVDLDELNGDKDVWVEFVAKTFSGATYRHQVELRGKGSWETIKFPKTFKNLLSVTWTQGDCLINKPHMFDNVVVRPSAK